jgi:hypothetical protein
MKDPWMYAQGVVAGLCVVIHVGYALKRRVRPSLGRVILSLLAGAGGVEGVQIAVLILVPGQEATLDVRAHQMPLLIAAIGMLAGSLLTLEDNQRDMNRASLNKNDRAD